MSNFTYGLVISLVGMGGTVAGLWFIILIVQLLKRVLLYAESSAQSAREVV